MCVGLINFVSKIYHKIKHGSDAASSRKINEHFNMFYMLHCTVFFLFCLCQYLGQLTDELMANA